MKILMINGTMRKESTYQVGRMLLEKFQTAEDEVTELFLPKDMPEFCRGCGVCIRESETKCFDYLMYMKRITRLIDESDLLIFTSPVYAFHVSGGMKALLDHYGYRFMIHRPEERMFCKQAVCIVTASKGGVHRALKDMKESLFHWGTAKIHTYGAAVDAMSWDEVDDEVKNRIWENLDRIEVKLNRNTEKVKPGLRTRILFYFMRSIQKKKAGHTADRKYWDEKGWTGKKRPWKS